MKKRNRRRDLIQVVVHHPRLPLHHRLHLRRKEGKRRGENKKTEGGGILVMTKESLGEEMIIIGAGDIGLDQDD